MRHASFSCWLSISDPTNHDVVAPPVTWFAGRPSEQQALLVGVAVTGAAREPTGNGESAVTMRSFLGSLMTPRPRLA
jgi:hypothetical protein